MSQRRCGAWGQNHGYHKLSMTLPYESDAPRRDVFDASAVLAGRGEQRLSALFEGLLDSGEATQAKPGI